MKARAATGPCVYLMVDDGWSQAELQITIFQN